MLKNPLRFFFPPSQIREALESTQFDPEWGHATTLGTP